MLNFKLKDIPRIFKLGNYKCKDHGIVHVHSEPKTHDILTFETESGRQCDVSATPWGFYLGPSLNSRLKKEGFRAALVTNSGNQLYLLAVEEDKIESFEAYLQENKSSVVQWLDIWAEDQEISSPHSEEKEQ